MRPFYKALMTLFALSTLPFLGQFSLFPLVGLFLLFLLSLYFEKKGRSLTKSTRFILISFYLISLYFGLGNLWSLEAGVSFLTFLALLKTFEINEKRDIFIYSLIIQLSLVGHLLSVEDLYMILVLLLILIHLFYLLFNFHSFFDQHRSEKDPRNEEIYSYRKRIFIQILIYSLPLATILFFVFPRFPLGNIFSNTMKKENRTGFTDKLRPGEISEVIQSQDTYFRVRFEQLRPNRANLYWRGMVLAKTDGFNWDRIHLGNDHVLDKRKNPSKNELKRVLYRYEVEYEFFSNGPLFLIDRPYRYDVLSRNHTVGMGGETFFSVAYRNQKLRYRAQSIRRNTQKTIKVSPLRTSQYLELPTLNPRFTQWIDSWRGEGEKRPKLVMEKMRSYFERNNFKYSLSPGIMNAQFPLDDFFFNKKIGLCEHYASVLAIALRALKIPSRVVVGFQGAQYNPYGEYFYVQGKNAHAWVEYWDELRGWQRVDPTEWIRPERIRLGPDVYFLTDENLESMNLDNSLAINQSGFLQNIFLMADMIYYELNREFLNFDIEKQEQIFDFLDLDDKSKYIKLFILSFILCLLFAGCIFFYFYWQRRRNREPLDEIYRNLEVRLNRHGIVLRSWWGPRKLFEEVSEIRPELREEIEEISKGIEELRYQRKVQRESVASLIRSLERKIKKL